MAIFTQTMKFTKRKLKPIMFVGTSSDVGKSVITAGFCRVFLQDGYNPSPFKAQNMSLNSFATPDGFEVGRAQAMQAEASGINCHTDMNPVLLKPTSDSVSQVILHGKPIGNQSARDYFLSENKRELFSEVTKAFERLSSKYNPVVMEGAGSISELNLKARDITNMRMSIFANADTYIVSDIERGGVFGSLYGTIKLLTPEERKQIKGIIINKFRGDVSLFEDGKQILEELCGVPVVGVMPYFRDIYLDEEDSVSLKNKFGNAEMGKVNIAVVLLNRISNFTDFARLERDERVRLYYSRDPKEIEKGDIIILPGSKNTIEDLIEIKNNGIANSIISSFKKGKKIIGICGGYQMMGRTIQDPENIESAIVEVKGLDLLPVQTVLASEKITRQRTFNYKSSAHQSKGYEIHMGRSTFLEDVQSLNVMDSGEEEGCSINGRSWGTYIHGILDNPEVIEDLLHDFTKTPGNLKSHEQFKEEQYDKLALWIRNNINMSNIYQSLIE
jgi:adenosylcobyric acid synthase